MVDKDNLEDISSILRRFETFYVKVKFSSEFKIINLNEDRKTLKVSLSQKPKNNKANIELIENLEKLGVNVKIISGFNSRKKYLKVLK